MQSIGVFGLKWEEGEHLSAKCRSALSNIKPAAAIERLYRHQRVSTALCSAQPFLFFHRLLLPQFIPDSLYSSLTLFFITIHLLFLDQFLLKSEQFSSIKHSLATVSFSPQLSDTGFYTCTGKCVCVELAAQLTNHRALIDKETQALQKISSSFLSFLF